MPERFGLTVRWRCLAIGVVLAAGPAGARALNCYPGDGVQTTVWFANHPVCQNLGYPSWHWCYLAQDYYCVDGSTGPIHCYGISDGGCPVWEVDQQVPSRTYGSCLAGIGGAEVCDGLDNNFDGCIDEGCTVGAGQCTCAASCNGSNSCSAPVRATCDPSKPWMPETCGNGQDDNCNGLVDEGCAPKAANQCGGTAGKDPILLYTRSAATEPFTDFSVDTIAHLEITRTYSSADWSLRGGPAVIFGRGWHHDWEATLTCSGDYCSVARGLGMGFTFRHSGAAASLDGLETWDVYTRGDTEVLQADDGHGILIRRPASPQNATDTWILFNPDGSELHFQTACDTCAADATCQDPRSGGVARLVDAYDPKGTRVHVSYDRASGLLIGISDDLGHALEARSATACLDARVRELRYDGSVVATYEYLGLDLDHAVDADGQVLRRYYYFDGGLLHAVVNEAGASVAEFAYDADGAAIGLVDAASDVGVSYAVTTSGNLLAQVTERVGNRVATSTRELDTDGNVVSVKGEATCGQRTVTWRNRLPKCTGDGAGHFVYHEYDAYGREAHRNDNPSSDICPGGVIGAGVMEEWYSYGLERQIAVGITLPLAVRTETRRWTGYSDQWVQDTLDYDPAPKAYDPEAYQCTEGQLRTGGVLCRRIQSGYVYAINGASNGLRSLERHATFYSYDSRARLVRAVGPVNLDAPSPDDVTPIEERIYWSEGESLARRGRLHEVKRYPRPTANPQVTTIDYDGFGPYAITEPSGTTILRIKNGRGRVQFETRAGLRTETRYYDGNEPRLVLPPGGSAVRTTYDSKGRRTLVEHLDGDPEAQGATPAVGWSEVTNFDPAGNVTHVERHDATGAVTWQQEREYDAMHRITRELHPERDGAARSWTYDAGGFLTNLTDEEQRGTVFVPDTFQRVLSVSRSGLDPRGAPVSAQVASYTYDFRKNALATVRDAKSQQTTYTPDDFGRVARIDNETFRDRGVWIRYDARGNLLERWNTNQVVRYTYDGLDRVLSVLAQECGSSDPTCTREKLTVPRVSYTYIYDENGNAGLLTSMLDGERTQRFGYDAAGRITEERLEEGGVAVPLVTSYAYGEDGRVSLVVHPSGLRLKVERDRATGEVRKLSTEDGTLTFADGISHWPGGPPRGFTFGSGESFSYAVNRRYEPSSLQSGPLTFGYGMTAAGNVETVQDGATTWRYVYDFRDRLVSSSPAGGASEDVIHKYATTDQWPYPAIDRLKQSGVARAGAFVKTQSYGYDHQTNVSAVTSWSSSGQVTGGMCLRHDALGRLALVGGTTHYATYGDDLTCVQDSDVTQVTARYRYDARNRRVARWLSSTAEWTYFAHGPGGELLSEMKRTGDAAQPWAPVRDYVWLDGRPVAQVEWVGGAPRPYYVHADHLGTPRKLTSPERAVVWSGTMQPYGEVSETTPADPVTGRVVVTNLRLPGQYDERLLGSLGLQGPYYNWNRWYLPSAGRYLELDPVALEGGLNSDYSADWYNYASANPTRFTDPSGLFILMDKCPNWAAALAKARQWAGCDGGEGSCGCKNSMQSCNACDVCNYLNDQSGPLVRVVSAPCGSGNLGCSYGQTSNFYGQAVGGNVVDIKASLCVGAINVDELARTLFHEALHQCLYWNHISDEPGFCSAEAITRDCAQ